MNINENVNFNGTVIIKDLNGMEIPVMHLSATIDTANMNININCNTVNKALVVSNPVDIKAQYEDFELAVKTRANELGFVIF